MTALLLAAAYVTGVVAVARAARLITSDTWPPTAALRAAWVRRTAVHDPQGLLVTDEDGDPIPGPWTPLLTCPFCLSPWIAAAVLAAAIAAGVWCPDLRTLAGWWWVLAVWASGSYAAPMIVLRDEPAPVDD